MFLLAAGYFALALSPTVGGAVARLTIPTFGTGKASTMRSLVTSTVNPQHMVQMFALITGSEMPRYLVSGLVLAALLKSGLNLAGI